MLLYIPTLIIYTTPRILYGAGATWARSEVVPWPGVALEIEGRHTGEPKTGEHRGNKQRDVIGHKKQERNEVGTYVATSISLKTAHMDSLPTETILHIISFLSGGDLKRFSLVSTRFTPLAQPVLFESVHLMGFGKISSSNFANFVDVVIKSPRIRIMIKRLKIGIRYDDYSHHQPLVQLLEQVHNLRELICYPYIHPPSIPFRPHQFPRLHRIKWPLPGTGTGILYTILPYSPVTDLSLLECPTHLRSKDAFTALLEPSSSEWINNLVKYRGCSYLIEGLSKDAKLLHFSSTNPLSEETLRGLASKRLLSLHSHTLMCPQSFEERFLPPSLLPPLFPNLQSVACLPMQLGHGVRDFS